jgi:ferritin-like metal-binding protein YciE
LTNTELRVENRIPGTEEKVEELDQVVKDHEKKCKKK